ncbi:hypothetical protein EJ06DRAFT_582860 [Trichodelitschia bisporula]|uniref:VIT-domain-containing protein n=1 Tax=Trichodelitschia bisporula TaxID=703511 RepID=A0A6G1HV15_9PEZI|nr:hypothetical protein EJ06DRAFT_582860 [Trichodelitschia bisporula]
MHDHICGFYYLIAPAQPYGYARRCYLPQVGVKAHATVLASTSRTVLTQTFQTPSTKGVRQLRYTFPLYDGVSVVGFTCHVNDRVITGEVKQKEVAKAEYQAAVDRGETAALLEQLPEASDVFTTTVGNVPPGARLLVNITYLGELKHDAEVDGIRFTIPTSISPRYGDYPGELCNTVSYESAGKSFEVTVDTTLASGSSIREMRSPSHPISVSLGTISTAPDADAQLSRASATLSLGSAELDKDFVLQIVAKETSVPKALLEMHPTMPGHRALMATLVPKFSLPQQRPEIVFVCDRSGSMHGTSITMLVNALKVFLKSLPLGVKFNICSFGSRYKFLWSKSKSYSKDTMNEAVRHVEGFDAGFGGTEILQPLKETISRRYRDMPLEVFLVTDGEIWQQQELFDMLNNKIIEEKAPMRVFTLGIGSDVSHSLIEGVARAGNGFAQAVGDNEKLDGKVVRMLKAALSPHVGDYTLELKYGDDDFEAVQQTASEAVKEATDEAQKLSRRKSLQILKDMVMKPISLFDTSAKLDDDPKKGDEKYYHLPEVPAPRIIQAPHRIPPLFAFSRTSIYLLLSPSTLDRTPISVVLRATSSYGPLELEIPVDQLDQPGETIHQLAAKKAIADLEEGRGWLTEANGASGTLLKTEYPGQFEDLVEREAVRLGIQYQVGGKNCSFVAVQKQSSSQPEAVDAEYDFIDDIDGLTLSEGDEGGPGSAGYTDIRCTSPPMTSRSLGNARLGGAVKSKKAKGGAFGSVLRGGYFSGLRPTSAAAPPSASAPVPFSLTAATRTLRARASSPGYAAQLSQHSTPAPGDADKATSYAPVSYGSESHTSELRSLERKVSGEAEHEVEGGGSAMQSLVDLQTFEGFWESNQRFWAIVHVDAWALLKKYPHFKPNVLATAVAIHFFQAKLAGEKEGWELLVDKARSWLESTIGGDKVDEVTAIAEKVIS